MRWICKFCTSEIHLKWPHLKACKTTALSKLKARLLASRETSLNEYEGTKGKWDEFVNFANQKFIWNYLIIKCVKPQLWVVALKPGSWPRERGEILGTRLSCEFSFLLLYLLSLSSTSPPPSLSFPSPSPSQLHCRHLISQVYMLRLMVLMV